MKVFLTGGTGFIGGEVARQLRGRGDEVRALVRDAGKAGALADLGCELVEGDLGDVAAIESGIEGCDAVIHGAAIYEVGVPESEHPRIYETNVRGTENVLGAALRAGTPKVVYISTVAALGDTRGQVVDETHEHSRDYGSYYEETKHIAHLAAKRLIAEGLPCVIVQPGGVYGPGDHSEVGNLLLQFADGKLPAMVFPDLGFNLVHRDDVAAGVLLALDRGEPGEAYVLGGEITTMGGMIETAARVLGRNPPRFTMPAIAIKAVAPFGRFIGPPLGFPPNLREAINTSDGRTFWASHDKAVTQLGYSPRGLEQGLRDTLTAEGRLAGAAA